MGLGRQCVGCGAGGARHRLRLANVTLTGPYCCACIDRKLEGMEGEDNEVTVRSARAHRLEHQARCSPTQEVSP